MKRIILVIMSMLLAMNAMCGTLSLNAENDLFAPSNDDKFYTHGSRISYLYEPSEHGWLSFSDPILVGNRTEYEFSIGQYMYTPDDISIETLQEGERPYAGVLYGEFAQIDFDTNRYSRIGYVFGVVGPDAKCEEAQTWVHKVYGAEKPLGWDNQINNEPILNVQYTYAWKAFQSGWYDVTPRLVGALGNADIFAGAGIDFRLGYNMRTWSYSVMEPLPRKMGCMSYYLLAGTEARFVARNITLDGNTFENSYSVDKENEVADFYLGGGFKYGDIAVEYKWTHRTDEFKGQREPEEFGSIALRFDV